MTKDLSLAQNSSVDTQAPTPLGFFNFFKLIKFILTIFRHFWYLFSSICLYKLSQMLKYSFGTHFPFKSYKKSFSALTFERRLSDKWNLKIKIDLNCRKNLFFHNYFNFKCFILKKGSLAYNFYKQMSNQGFSKKDFAFVYEYLRSKQ